LQVYYNLPEFVNAILEFKDDGEPLPPLTPLANAAQDSNPQDQAPAGDTEET
jgi:hypothetical protein|tara:strand:+ start:476 stop:631 length:156 start_codon:yes stop_codon:yes gene_type:complete